MTRSHRRPPPANSPTTPRSPAANEYFQAGKYLRADEYYTDLRQAYPTSEHQFSAHFLGLKTKLMSYLGPNYSTNVLDDAEKLIKQMRRQFPPRKRRREGLFRPRLRRSTIQKGRKTQPPSPSTTISAVNMAAPPTITTASCGISPIRPSPRRLKNGSVKSKTCPRLRPNMCPGSWIYSRNATKCKTWSSRPSFPLSNSSRTCPLQNRVKANQPSLRNLADRCDNWLRVVGVQNGSKRRISHEFSSARRASPATPRSRLGHG
jgi:hypothetical protein